MGIAGGAADAAEVVAAVGRGTSAGFVAGGRATPGSKPGFGVTRGKNLSRCEPMRMRGLSLDVVESVELPVAAALDGAGV
jgi:hypothetical protein